MKASNDTIIFIICVLITLILISILSGCLIYNTENFKNKEKFEDNIISLLKDSSKTDKEIIDYLKKYNVKEETFTNILNKIKKTTT